jgi:endoglucanase
MLSAAVVESYPSRAGVLRGIDLAGGVSNAPDVAPTSTFSNVNPGVYGAQYLYDGQASLNFLARRHVGVVRVGFRWERIQHQLFGPLDPNELSRLRAVVTRAHAAGLQVVLDLHNYGGYYLDEGGLGVRQTLGTPQLPFAAFADVWGRLAVTFKDAPGLAGMGLMNEPAHMQSVAGVLPAKLWEQASQLATTSIRAANYTGVLLVGGYNWSDVGTWPTNHPIAWINDPLNNVRYEAHQYFTVATGAQYTHTYADETAAAR